MCTRLKQQLPRNAGVEECFTPVEPLLRFSLHYGHTVGHSPLAGGTRELPNCAPTPSCPLEGPSCSGTVRRPWLHAPFAQGTGCTPAGLTGFPTQSHRKGKVGTQRHSSLPPSVRLQRQVQAVLGRTLAAHPQVRGREEGEGAPRTGMCRDAWAGDVGGRDGDPAL